MDNTGDRTYRAFVNALASGKHPAYGRMIWDGETKLTSFTIQFQRDRSETAEVVRGRAVDYFARLRPHEWALFQIEVILRGGLPVFATVTPREGASQLIKLGTGRLKELAEDA